LFFGVTTDVFAVLLGEEGVELGFLDSELFVWVADVAGEEVFSVK
jgi:hypothetical protein